ncbi:Signal transducing MAP protein kinase [Malassezia pachydermatis]|uniref:mitogen-activated protein kinase kinase n=1 Tax=Malassezia pachydermatis TaxID=77020 RepID=A0A0M8MXV8_9BASI|nr:Signal transducing MAP protein kinase [Malassezia pachydermatis]KOS15761.1 Signal transducing MAP protein kinase [Malassezia pachydermatis]
MEPAADGTSAAPVPDASAGTHAEKNETEAKVANKESKTGEKRVPGGFAASNARTKEMAMAKLPPSLRAKLEENVRRSANASPVSLPEMGASDKLNPSLLRAKVPPVSRTPPPPRPRQRPGPGLRLSDLGSALPSASAPSKAPSLSNGRPKLSLGMLPGQEKPPESPFGSFSKIVDPSGRLIFDGKAILHESGVEFKNGTSFNINMDELEVLDKLGHGNYGTVTHVRHTRTKVEMAMKEIRLELDEAKLNAIIMELDILHRAIAPQIVEFYGAFFVESCVYYCMEYMDVGSLDKLSTGRHCMVPDKVLARIASSTVKGLHFLKDRLQIIHRDVKPTNMLINSRGEVKLCDFGVSGQLEKSLAKTNIGCQSYMAPERIKGDVRNALNTYTVASDVWSLGISLVEIAMGCYPYPPETFTNMFAQLQAIVEGNPPELPHPSKEPITVTMPSGSIVELELGTCEYSDAARDFVAQCLCKIPEKRPTYATLLEHEFVTRDNDVNMVAWAAEANAHNRAPKPDDKA